MGRLGNTSPVRRSRNVTVAPNTKLFPLIVNGCGLFEPITGFGLMLLMDGVTAEATTWKTVFA